VIKSEIRKVGPVTFPAFTGERIYMRPFKQRAGLPKDLRRWQETVDAMLGDLKTEGPIYLMVDQGRVVAGSAHRRPGVHIEGNWQAGRWGYGGTVGRHGWRGRIGWAEFDPEAVILASDVQGCAAYLGDFDGCSRPGGDCTHIDVSGAKRVLLEPFVSYAGTVTTLHESLPLQHDTVRTVVRLNVPL
jgi:hypothetical protein